MIKAKSPKLGAGKVPLHTWTGHTAKAAWKAFNTDGCTKVPDFDFRACCDEHDIAYMTGKKFWKHKVRSDIRLMGCIMMKGTVAHATIAPIYFLGVSTFGLVPWFRKRWKER